MATTIQYKRGRRRGGPKRQDIVDAALKLFAQKGYAATSMSDIARAAQLDQSSLYYWFSKKEDILKDILVSNQASIRVASQLGSYPGDKPLQLYTVLYTDVLMLCDIPFDYYDLETVAYEQPDSFAQFFTDYQTLFNYLRRIIDDGIADKSFKNTDSASEAMAALALNEGLQHRFRRQTITNKVANKIADKTAIDFARIAASTTLGKLMAKGDVSTLEAEAKKRSWL